jgi:hypothetical protein
MADRRLSVHDRVLVLDYLSQTAFYLNQLATWLAEHDAITESDKAEEAAEKLCTAAWLLERPIRAQRLPGQWQPSPDGYVMRR